MTGGGRSRLLSLPIELLEAIFTRIVHPPDLDSVALTCSRLRQLIRCAPLSLSVNLVSPSRPIGPSEWFNLLKHYSKALHHQFIRGDPCSPGEPAAGGSGIELPGIEGAGDHGTASY
ncbi:hypothetical protein CLOP_g1543 [Closterium sp. NIES-67]|nr:hypothetical protein CLOP_g1543 [Closterium sp. NIES-67]